MRLPEYIKRDLQMLRMKIPQDFWPEIDEIISWAGDRAYKQRRKKKHLTFGDFTAVKYGDRYLVTDVNGDAEYTVPGLVKNEWEAIDLIISARKVKES